MGGGNTGCGVARDQARGGGRIRARVPRVHHRLQQAEGEHCDHDAGVVSAVRSL